MSPRFAIPTAVALGAALLAASAHPAAAQNQSVYVNNFAQGAGGGIGIPSSHVWLLWLFCYLLRATLLLLGVVGQTRGRGGFSRR